MANTAVPSVSEQHYRKIQLGSFHLNVALRGLIKELRVEATSRTILPERRLAFRALALCQSESGLIRSDEGLTLETSAFNLFTVADLPYQLS